MARILLIEDEVNIRKITAYDLRNANYEIVECADGKEAIELAKREEFDVYIIDWMLPHVSGIDIVKALRANNVDSILIMLTARDDEADVLYAFENGVDDYITKPFSPRELLARVNAHLKRQKKKEERLLAGKLSMDMKRREAFIDNEGITLTKKEFDLLECFVRNKGVVLSRDNILNDIWGFDYDGDTRIVDVHVFKLRNKLQKASVTIKSSRGVGYLLEELHEAA